MAAARTRVAAALRIPRNKPYQDAIKKRVAVAKQILLQAAPLAVGDEVVCTHGTGILVDFISLDHPCSIKFTHGPWNLKHAKQESCLCKACENFGMYETALSDIVGFLNDAMLDGASDVESIPKDERDPVLSLPQYLQIDQLNKFKRCIEKVESMWCSDAFEKGKMGCIDPGGCGHDTPCDTCGFKSVWSQGLRPELLDDNGDLQDGVNPAWLAEVKWSRYKTETDSDGKKALRGERIGSVIEFFDEFEKMFKKYAYHR